MSHFLHIFTSLLVNRGKRHVCRLKLAHCGLLMDTSIYLVQLLHYKATIPTKKIVQFFFLLTQKRKSRWSKAFKVFKFSTRYCIQNKTGNQTITFVKIVLHKLKKPQLLCQLLNWSALKNKLCQNIVKYLVIGDMQGCRSSLALLVTTNQNKRHEPDPGVVQ